MKTNQATSAAKDINEIEWGVIEGENTEFAAQYARFQWIHGSKQAAGFMKTGGLFVSKEQYPNFTGEGFEPTLLITRDGTEIEGYAAPAAKLAVIRIKHQWVKDENGRNVPLAHILCVVKGCDDLVCISLRGASKSLDFQKAFNQHLGQNVALANRTRPDGAFALEAFALWFPLVSGAQHSITSKDGKANSSVTSPEMSVPENLDRDYVVSLWVGAESYKVFAGFFKETSVWQKQPIWEQRENGVSESPEFSGNGITSQQADMLAGLIEAKHLGADEVNDFILTASNGATNNIKALTRDEATAVIGTMKAY